MTDKKHNSELDLDKSLMETTHKVEHFYHNNKRNINILLVAVVVLVGGYIGYKRLYIEPKEQEAQKEVFMAQKAFEADSFDLALKGNGTFKGFDDIAAEY